MNNDTEQTIAAMQRHYDQLDSLYDAIRAAAPETGLSQDLLLRLARIDDEQRAVTRGIWWLEGDRDCGREYVGARWQATFVSDWVR
jgi:hypothetical protein